MLTVLFVCQHPSEAPASVWTFLTVVQITTNHILPTAQTSPGRPASQDIVSDWGCAGAHGRGASELFRGV